MKLFLHIGTEKTGTTTIQDSLKENRAALMRQGFYVPECLGIGNHRWLPTLAFGPNVVDDFFFRHQLNKPEVRQEKVSSKLKELHKELSSVSVPNVIITSEHLHSRLRSQGEICQVRDMLSPYFNDVEVIMYVRDPFSLAVSLYSTTLRAGMTDTDIMAPDRPYMTHSADFRSSVGMWGGAFGVDNITVRAFEKSLLVGEDVLSDFYNIVGVDSGNFLRSPRKNEALSIFALQILLEVNCITWRDDFSPQKSEAIRQKLIPILENRFGSMGVFKGSQTMMRAYSDAFGESVEWLRNIYFPDRTQIFTEPSCRTTPDWRVFPGAKEVANALLDLL